MYLLFNLIFYEKKYPQKATCIINLENEILSFCNATL